MAEQQVWKIPVSPGERWALYQLSHAKGLELEGQKGRIHRRFIKALGIDVFAIRLLSGKSIKSLPTKDLTTKELFTITAENRDYLLELTKGRHHPDIELMLSDLLDIMETLDGYKPDESLKDFVRDDSRWEAETKDPIEEAVKQITVYLKSKGWTDAATAVDRGDWETKEGSKQNG